MSELRLFRERMCAQSASAAIGMPSTAIALNITSGRRSGLTIAGYCRARVLHAPLRTFTGGRCARKIQSSTRRPQPKPHPMLTRPQRPSWGGGAEIMKKHPAGVALPYFHAREELADVASQDGNGEKRGWPFGCSAELSSRCAAGTWPAVIVSNVLLFCQAAVKRPVICISANRRVSVVISMSNALALIRFLSHYGVSL